ncbi:MAG TPA: hypothetical protein VFX70_06520 [Mycobacteriales bacterium]|nr:hypothetical protein [Mycobacteriales bacterium]
MPRVDWSSLLGQWSVSGRMIEITRSGDDVLVTGPGLPPELSLRLEPPDPTGSGAPVMRGGPYEGLTVTTVDRDGVPHLLVGGVITLPPWDHANPVPPVAWLPAPASDLSPETERAFRDLLAEVRTRGGGPLHPPNTVRLGDWVRWATEHQAVLFHGSSDGGIDELSPRRTSYELNDEAGRGNRGAVYATDDGWWAMWFAVVDRARLRGSIRSTVDDFTAADGTRRPVYSFSVDHRELPRRLWRNGWLYVLGHETFERLPIVPGGPPSHEWCSTEPVTPLARIPVSPADFPFLRQVGGHDDGDLLRFEDLADVVGDHTVAARDTDLGVALRLTWDGDLAAVTEEYLDLARTWMPEVSREFRRDADGVTWLHLAAPPELAPMLRHRYRDLPQA